MMCVIFSFQINTLISLDLMDIVVRLSWEILNRYTIDVVILKLILIRFILKEFPLRLFWVI